jgi:hypothetical protein
VVFARSVHHHRANGQDTKAFACTAPHNHEMYAGAIDRSIWQEFIHQKNFIHSLPICCRNAFSRPIILVRMHR